MLSPVFEARYHIILESSNTVDQYVGTFSEIVHGRSSASKILSHGDQFFIQQMNRSCYLVVMIVGD